MNPSSGGYYTKVCIVIGLSGNYSPALKKWGLYWICPVSPSVILSFCNSVIILVSAQYLENQWTEFNKILYTH